MEDRSCTQGLLGRYSWRDSSQISETFVFLSTRLETGPKSPTDPSRGFGSYQPFLFLTLFCYRDRSRPLRVLLGTILDPLLRPGRVGRQPVETPGVSGTVSRSESVARAGTFFTDYSKTRRRK